MWRRRCCCSSKEAFMIKSAKLRKLVRAMTLSYLVYTPWLHHGIYFCSGSSPSHLCFALSLISLSLSDLLNIRILSSSLSFSLCRFFLSLSFSSLHSSHQYLLCLSPPVFEVKVIFYTILCVPNLPCCWCCTNATLSISYGLAGLINIPEVWHICIYIYIYGPVYETKCCHD